MALESRMVPLGTPMPDVALPDLDGNRRRLREYADGQPLLIVFACNHCPYVRWVEALLGELVVEQQIGTVAINSNDAAAYPDDGPDGMREQMVRADWQFPYLVDDSQQVARDFGAVCTPDFFLFGAEGLLVYRGAFDSSTPKNGQPLTGDLLRQAITAARAGQTPPEPHRPSMGCGIKWKA
ncbi:MAG: thioredoxin family protein [Candidatus Nanopelagicales bacterium]|nr:thioredoxin family protein [Candidatus Nanopelagicales bacterium]